MKPNKIKLEIIAALLVIAGALIFAAANSSSYERLARRILVRVLLGFET
jgi:uncharacterized membrane protein